MEKTILLIDDSPEQKEVLESLEKHLREKEGINVLSLYVNPIDRLYWDDSKDPSIDNLIPGISERIIDRRPNLIVVDYYYSQSQFNGLNVIEKLRSIAKLKQVPIFLISGKRNKIVNDIFARNSTPTGQKVKELSKLIEYRIEKFLDKDFKSDAIELLKRRNLNDVLPAKLREVENGKLHLFSPRYRILPMGSLADLIESNSPETPKILDEIFTLTLSHYIKINEGLQ